MKSASKFFYLFIIIFFSAILNAQGVNSWTNGNYSFDIVSGKINISEANKKLITISSINFNFTKPKSITPIEQSNEKLVLQLRYPATASYSNLYEDVLAVVEITVRGNTIRFRGEPEWASNVTIQLEDNGERFFGILQPLFPNNQKSPDLRGEVVDVDVLGDASQYHENYASAWSAFYMTNKGYASFFDSFAAGRYKLGINGVTELYHRTGNLDWHIITGKNGDEIMKAYYEIIGKPKFVPMWACGPIGWRDQNNGGKDEILDDIKKMTDLKIPFTSWWVDRPYSDGGHGWSKMNFTEKFANPKEWIGVIRNKYGMEFMTWVTSATFGDPDFPGILPSKETYFDLTNANAIKEFQKRLNEHQYSVGVKGHKIDRADQLFPQMFPWKDGTPVAERRNKYIYLLSKTIDTFLREKYNDDQVNFARAAFHRCQPYLTAVWGGDSRASWDGLAGNLANAIRCSFMGFPIWGSDVGGYLGGRIPENLYARWLQFGAWSAFYEIKIDDAGGRLEDRPPWKYSKQLQNIFRDCNYIRMELLPFIYSLANTSYKNGVVMKPLAYVYPEDSKTYDIWDTYLLGNTFLVAPILDSSNTRKIYLPQGVWLDYYDMNKSYEGNKEITVTQPLERIPVFIKSNSIYVTGRMISGNTKIWDTNPKKELNIYAFPGKTDESSSFNYVDYLENNIEKTFTLANKYVSLDIYIPSLSIASSVQIKLDKKPASVSINNKAVNFTWDNKNRIAKIQLSKNSESNIVVKK